MTKTLGYLLHWLLVDMKVYGYSYDDFLIFCDFCCKNVSREMYEKDVGEIDNVLNLIGGVRGGTPPLEVVKVE